MWHKCLVFKLWICSVTHLRLNSKGRDMQSAWVGTLCAVNVKCLTPQKTWLMYKEPPCERSGIGCVVFISCPFTQRLALMNLKVICTSKHQLLGTLTALECGLDEPINTYVIVNRFYNFTLLSLSNFSELVTSTLTMFAFSNVTTSLQLTH